MTSKQMSGHSRANLPPNLRRTKSNPTPSNVTRGRSGHVRVAPPDLAQYRSATYAPLEREDGAKWSADNRRRLPEEASPRLVKRPSGNQRLIDRFIRASLHCQTS